jgi:hypothetical protein
MEVKIVRYETNSVRKWTSHQATLSQVINKTAFSPGIAFIQ